MCIYINRVYIIILIHILIYYLILTIIIIKPIMKYCRLAVYLYLAHLIIIVANSIKSISKDIVALIFILSLVFLTILVDFINFILLIKFINFILLLTQTKRNRRTIRRFL